MIEKDKEQRKTKREGKAIDDLSLIKRQPSMLEQLEAVDKINAFKTPKRLVNKEKLIEMEKRSKSITIDKVFTKTKMAPALVDPKFSSIRQPQLVNYY